MCLGQGGTGVSPVIVFPTRSSRPCPLILFTFHGLEKILGTGSAGLGEKMRAFSEELSKAIESLSKHLRK